ncbi:aldo/keto reductase [Rhizobium laguerreae]|uniref:aldo/keto reductase n=1 Tax=Rhizobium laguerreae TaxID=1076926 RepID=UPI001C90991B|nr:aldo/keto reductase [Rhizobium laguerreae]MBY3163904.1 aldo/keto reductase [Rhizobium laguerreae]
MELRQIGKTPLKCSVLSLGAAPLGGLFAPVTEADASATVEASLRVGIKLIDVAPHYGQGLAEIRLGKALQGLPNDNYLLSTKVGRLLEPSESATVGDNWPEALNFTTVYDTSRRGILKSLEDSCRRLGTSEIDIAFLHDPDRYAKDSSALKGMISEVFETLSELRSQGRVKAIGIGANAPEPCFAAMQIGRWDCFVLAGTYSVLRQEDKGLLDACLASSVSVLIGGPYMSGALAGGSTWRYKLIPQDIADDIERLRTLCDRHKVPMQAAALQFPLRHPAVSSVIVGMRSAPEVAENYSFLNAPIPDGFWSDLEKEGLARR